MKTRSFGPGRSSHLSRVIPVPRLVLILISFFMLAPCWAQRQPARSPLPSIDQRTAAATVATPSVASARAAESLRQFVPSLKVAFEPVTSSPKSVSATEGFLTGPNGSGATISAASLAVFAVDDPQRVTKAFLTEHRDLFGHGPEALAPARVVRDYISPNNGMHTVVWEQQVDGIQVFDGVLISHTTSKGELVSIASQFVPDPAAAADLGTPNAAALIGAPSLSASRAVVLAAENIEVTLDETNVVQVADVTGGPEQMRKFTAPGLKGETGAKLIWFPMAADSMRLCWDVVLMSRQRGEMYRVLLDVESGEVLVRRCLTSYLTDATYNVFTSDSPSPFSPGWPTPNTGQPALGSRTLVTLPAMNTNASPAGWINDGANQTWGNNVDAHTDRNYDNVADVPRPQGSPARVFNFPMDLATQDPTNYASAAVVQLFYLCNWYHDKLYELGFTEAAGNFQSNNFSRGGLGNDAVQADAQDGSGYDNANFSTPADGLAGRMQMYIFTHMSPRRDGDFDAEVVFHEFSHGLSWRLVGGGQVLGDTQSDGMGEGWGDFYGLTLLSQPGDDVNGVYASGGYASHKIGGAADTQNYYFGIRRYPYTTDLSKNPLTFNDIDPAQANYCASSAPFHTGMFGSCSASSASEVHNEGEVWCVTLWDARANLINKYGWTIGNQLILQLVTDGMKLTPPHPNFLQARDAIFQADLVDTGGANRNELWAAFAKRGMGYGATSPASSTTTGLHESFEVPDNLQITPTILSASGPLGGPFAPNPASFVLTNTGSSSLTWTLGSTSAWISVFPTGGFLAAGGPGANVTVTVLPAATNLAMGTYNSLIRFTNATSGVSQPRPFSLFVVGRNMYDDFDPGIDLTQWAGFGGTVGITVLATNYGGYISSPNSLWFGDAGSRFATTLPINTTGGGTVGFSICLANGAVSPWETADALPGEGVVLEASSDSGVSWILLGSYDTIACYVWTNVLLTIPPSVQAAATQFRWRQKSHSGLGFDHWALDNVTIDAGPMPPLIQAQPLSQTVPVGVSASFSVSAVGSAPLGYFWLRNGALISGANGPSYATNNVQLSDAGAQFSCWVSNSFGMVTSSVATLTVLAVPPTITQQPASQTLLPGSTATFSVSVTGSQPLNYAWTRNGTPIAGATNSSYFTNNVQLTDSGAQFACAVNNAFGSTNSQAATLTVVVYPPTISTQPVSQSVSAGSSASFSVSATGTGPLGYYWRRNGTPIAGANSYYYSTNNVQLSDSGTQFSCTVSNAYGMTNSQAATLTVVAYPPSIIVHPQNQTVVAGNAATFTVSASGTAPLSYSWRRNGAPISGANSISYTTNNVQLTDSATQFSCLVSNA